MKFIRQKAPFILLAISFFATILDLFSIFDAVFNYLPDLFGYSILTNVFMMSVYWNDKYCTATKIAVFGLMIMNIFSLIVINFDFYSVYYNLILELIIILIVLIYLIKGNDSVTS